MRFIRAISALMALAAAATARGEIQPDEIGIIGVAAGRNSPSLARHYAEVRGVPESHILLLEGPAPEELSREEWDTRVRPAIRAWLAGPERAGKIRCLVTMMDVPLKIGRRDPNLPVVAARRKFLAEARADRVGRINTVIKSLDTVGAEPAKSHPELKPGAVLAEVAEAFEMAFKGAEKRARESPADSASRQAPQTLQRNYIAVLGLQQMLAVVERSSEAGHAAPQAYQQTVLIRGELRGLRDSLRNLLTLTDSEVRDRRILALLEQATGLLGALRWIDGEREGLEKNETYASFDSELSLIFWDDYPLPRWQPNLLHYSYDRMPGDRRKTLMVSRIAAPTAALARNLIDTAVQVEKDGLRGRVYLDARGFDYHPKIDKRGSYAEYDQSLRDLADRLRRRTKLEVVLDNKPELFAPGSCGEAALYCGWYSLGKYVDAFGWRAGAVGYHLASAEATTLTRPGSTVWCNAMLERGVCATLGPAYEPYLVAFPLPDDFFPLLLTGRHTLAETYYRTSPFTSWVMVLVGDPLYNPFKNTPLLTESDLPDRLTHPRDALGITGEE